MKEGRGTVHPSFVEAGVACLLREGSLLLEAASDGMRHERLDRTGSGERNIGTSSRSDSYWTRPPSEWRQLSTEASFDALLSAECGADLFLLSKDRTED